MDTMLGIFVAVLLAPFYIAASPINSSFTLTAYAPGNSIFNALKANYVGGLVLFKEKVRQYCPSPPVDTCPNGTATAWYNGLAPSAMVPGGQDSYVLASGLVQITPQHSHSKPSGSFWSYDGFTCNVGLPQTFGFPSYVSCNSSSPLYDCSKPVGLCTWKLPSESEGGVFACPNPYDVDGTSIFVKTPGFNATGCTALEGLAAHMFDGGPPVWSYI